MQANFVLADLYQYQQTKPSGLARPWGPRPRGRFAFVTMDNKARLWFWLPLLAVMETVGAEFGEVDDHGEASLTEGPMSGNA